ncbi:MAG TPA: HEAT repeat domain-containing protein [Candidatus Tectomicrobia bacterium]
MKLLDKFRVKKWLAVLQATPDSTDPAQRQALARLSQIGRPAIPYLLPALGHIPTPTILVEFLTTRVTPASLPYFVQGLSDRNPRVVAEIVTILSHSRGYDPHSLLELLIDSTTPKAALVQILVAHKETLRPKALLDLCHIAPKDGRTAVLRLIDQVATEAMVPALLPHARSDDGLMRLHMAQILGRFSTAASRETLLQLVTDAHKSVRLAALEGLAGLGMPVEVGPLCALLRDPDLTVQSKAIEAIIQIKHPQTLRHILDILQDESEYVRRAAVEVLNVVGTTEAIKDLLGALGDEDWWVRARASDALGTIGGPKVVEAVLPLLKEADAFIRRCAVEILNTTKDPQAFQALIEALDDPDWWVQERAVDALAALGDRRAVPALLPLLQGDTPAAPAVLRALGSLGDPRAMPAVLATLPHGTSAVRKEALQALVTLTEASQAALVQQAVLGLTQGPDSDLKPLAESVLRTLVTKYGARLRHAPVAPPSMLAHRSLLSDSGMGMLTSLTSDSKPYETTVVNMSGASPVPAAFPNAETLQLEPGVVLDGRYRVVRRVGKGGFGIAVLVEDMVVNEEIILKFLHASLAADERLIHGFIRELRYARKITHENVIRIYDFLCVGGAYAISMEYFPSHTLAAETLPLPIPRGLNIISDICKGMSVAHHADIVHRDLKPQNILIDEHDLVKIVDFGLAAGVSPTDSRLTQRSARMGTPAYMAPEQVRGGSVDPRTDIYSLGVIMYELFAGTPPYVGNDPIEIALQHVEGNVNPPGAYAPDLPPALEAIILKAMAVQPADRFQSMDTLCETLTTLAL